MIDEARAMGQQIADFVTEFSLAAAPGELVEVTETAFIDTVGVMLAGSRTPSARIVRDVVAAEGAAPRAGTVGTGLRTSPQNAALANGIAGQALDFDLSFMIGQSAAPLIPGLLPLAESLGSETEPSEVIAAFVVGCEVCARLARSFPTLSSEGGWHGAGVLGTISAAAGFARLAKAPRETIPSVIGISASMASGIGVNFGTMTKPLHPGLASRNGMTATFLGMKGFTASSDAIEGHQGFLPSFAKGLPWNTDSFADLGERFYLLDPGYKIKPFPCGGLMHTAIEAALNLRDKVAAQKSPVARISIGVTAHAADRAIDAYPWSEDSARFSLRYLVPYALVHGPPTIAAFSEEAIDDDELRALGERVEAHAEEEFSEVKGSGYSPSKVTIEFEDGARLEETVLHQMGTRKTPLGEERFREKFFSCATRAVGEGQATEIYDYLSGLGSRETLADLWPLLVAEEG